MKRKMLAFAEEESKKIVKRRKLSPVATRRSTRKGRAQLHDERLAAAISSQEN